MGYQIYKVGQRWGGYGVYAICEHPDCKEEIDRGVSFACGGEPFSSHGCDRYFCEKHRQYLGVEGSIEACDHEEKCDCKFIGVCERCFKGEASFDYKPEHPEWIEWLLTDESWKEWREKNPEDVKSLKECGYHYAHSHFAKK